MAQTSDPTPFLYRTDDRAVEVVHAFDVSGAPDAAWGYAVPRREFMPTRLVVTFRWSEGTAYRARGWHLAGARATGPNRVKGGGVSDKSNGHRDFGGTLHSGPRPAWVDSLVEAARELLPTVPEL